MTRNFSFLEMFVSLLFFLRKEIKENPVEVRWRILQLKRENWQTHWNLAGVSSESFWKIKEEMSQFNQWFPVLRWFTSEPEKFLFHEPGQHRDRLLVVQSHEGWKDLCGSLVRNSRDTFLSCPNPVLSLMTSRRSLERRLERHLSFDALLDWNSIHDFLFPFLSFKVFFPYLSLSVFPSCNFFMFLSLIWGWTLCLQEHLETHL